jgi:hypothetical protein
MLVCAALAGAQPRPVNSTKAQSVQVRSKTLNALFSDYWEDHLRHAPEDATALGDFDWNGNNRPT